MQCSRREDTWSRPHMPRKVLCRFPRMTSRQHKALSFLCKQCPSLGCRRSGRPPSHMSSRQHRMCTGHSPKRRRFCLPHTPIKRGEGIRGEGRDVRWDVRGGTRTSTRNSFAFFDHINRYTRTSSPAAPPFSSFICSRVHDSLHFSNHSKRTVLHVSAAQSVS
jgi:hypothetical protein